MIIIISYIWTFIIYSKPTMFLNFCWNCLGNAFFVEQLHGIFCIGQFIKLISKHRCLFGNNKRSKRQTNSASRSRFKISPSSYTRPVLESTKIRLTFKMIWFINLLGIVRVLLQIVVLHNFIFFLLKNGGQICRYWKTVSCKLESMLCIGIQYQNCEHILTLN